MKQKMSEEIMLWSLQYYSAQQGVSVKRKFSGKICRFHKYILYNFVYSKSINTLSSIDACPAEWLTCPANLQDRKILKSSVPFWRTMPKTPRPVEDIRIHKIRLLLNGEYKYCAVKLFSTAALTGHSDKTLSSVNL